MALTKVTGSVIEVASQAEAEAGTINNKFMTPERTFQSALAYRGSDRPAFYVRCSNSADGNLRTNTAHLIGRLNGGHFSSVTVENDVGGDFSTSTGLFTAPIAGRYFFTAGVTAQNSGGNPRGYLLMRLNGNNEGPLQYYYNLNYNGTAGSILMYLSANDTVSAEGLATNSIATTIYTAHFSGFFIG